MDTPDDLRYHPLHTWVRREPDGEWTVGITDHAQAQLGDVVFLEFRAAPGQQIAAEEAVGVIESVKSASDLHAPAAGTVTAVNEAALASPETVNAAPYDTWLLRLRPAAASAWDTLLDAGGYRAGVEPG